MNSRRSRRRREESTVTQALGLCCAGASRHGAYAGMAGLEASRLFEGNWAFFFYDSMAVSVKKYVWGWPNPLLGITKSALGLARHTLGDPQAQVWWSTKM